MSTNTPFIEITFDRTQYPRMIPFRKPYFTHISLTVARSVLSSLEPYWPCIRTLNISTESTYQFVRQCFRRIAVVPGLASTAFAAPAIEPAKAICCNERSGKGETTRLDAAYAANSKELTPAIPSSGLAMPE